MEGTTTRPAYSTLKSAARLAPINQQWKLPPHGTQILSADLSLITSTTDCTRRLVFGDLSDIGPAPRFNIPAHHIDCEDGETSFGAHLILLPHPHRHASEMISEPYAVVCTPDLDPTVLATIYQGSDHDYLHHNIGKLEQAGQLVHYSWFCNSSSHQEDGNVPYVPYEKEMLLRHLKTSFLDEVNRVRRCDHSSSPCFASLKAEYTQKDDQSLASRHIKNMLYVTLRRGCGVPAINTDITAALDGCSTVKRTLPVKMQSSWLSGSVTYERAELHTLPRLHQQDTACFAFNIPGLADHLPAAVLFVGDRMKVKGVVIGRGLNQVKEPYLTEYRISTPCRCARPSTCVLSYTLEPPPEYVDHDGDSDCECHRGNPGFARLALKVNRLPKTAGGRILTDEVFAAFEESLNRKIKEAKRRRNSCSSSSMKR